MFISLRSRLWLSYLAVIGLVLLVVTLALLLFLYRNPRLTRVAESNLILATNALQRQRTDLSEDSNLETLVQRADELFDVRVLVYNAQDQLLADSRSASNENFPELSRLAIDDRPGNISEFTDSSNVAWLLNQRHLSRGLTMVVASPRPAAPLASILSDEFFLPIIRAGGLALILSILLSYLVARWIADPLQQITNASKELGAGKMSLIEPSGPKEVQTLAQSFNAMSRQLAASQKSQRDFVSNVSHELKTPLTSVQGFAQAIMDGTAKGGEALQQAGKVIYDEAGRMHRLVLGLLDIARLDAGTAELEYTQLDMTELLRTVIDRFTPQAEAAKLSLEMQSTQMHQFYGDQDRLTQVFNNLLENALKFTPAGGKIAIDIQEIKGNLQVSVTDTGTGISEDEIDRIFERFYQADKSRRAGRSRGVGLGLPIAKQIVEAHHGSINVESLLNQGTRFLVSLPMETKQA
jgi:signal transduction histidine kinase